MLLLADVFEKFRNNSLKNYGLSPCHYLSAPALSWNTMLNMTKFELKLISDADMYLFFRKGMRGGASYISNRYSESNNKCFKSFDAKQESKLITYLDANKWYGYAMSKFLPTDRFKLIDPKELDSSKYSSNSLKDCVLEIDFKYPKELRELYYDNVLVPDKIEIKMEMLSNY